MENVCAVHKINPVGMGKSEVPPLKNYLRRISISSEFVKEFLGESLLKNCLAQAEACGYQNLLYRFS